MSYELQDDFVAGGHDLSAITLDFCTVFGIEPDGHVPVSQTTSDGLTRTYMQTPWQTMKGWQLELEEQGMSSSEATYHIGQSLEHLAQMRLGKGEEIMLKEMMGEDYDPKTHISKILEFAGATDQDFEAYLKADQEFEVPEGATAVNKSIADNGIQDTVDRARAYSSILLAQSESKVRLPKDLGQSYPDRCFGHIQEQVQKLEIDKLKNHYIEKWSRELESSQRKSGHLQVIDNSIDKRRTQIRDINLRMVRGRVQLVAHRQQLRQKLTEAKVYARLEARTDRNIRAAAKGIQHLAHRSRVENFWKSPEGRVMRDNILQQAASLSHATRQLHDKTRSPEPTQQDIQNANQALDRVIRSGSISQAKAIKEVHSVIDVATEQCGKDLTRPRTGRVYSHLAGQKLTKKEGLEMMPLKDRREALTQEDRMLIERSAVSKGTSIEAVEPERLNEKDQGTLRNAVVEKGVAVKPEQEMPLTQEDKRLITDLSRDGDVMVEAQEPDKEAQKDKLYPLREKLDNKEVTRDNYHKVYEREHDKVAQQEKEKDQEAEKETKRFLVQERRHDRERDQNVEQNRGRGKDDYDITD